MVKVRYVTTAATFHLRIERGGRGGSLRTKKWSWNYEVQAPLDFTVMWPNKTLFKLGTLNILGWIILCCGECAVHCRMFSSLTVLYLVNVSCDSQNASLHWVFCFVFFCFLPSCFGSGIEAPWPPERFDLSTFSPSTSPV